MLRYGNDGASEDLLLLGLSVERDARENQVHSEEQSDEHIEHDARRASRYEVLSLRDQVSRKQRHKGHLGASAV